MGWLKSSIGKKALMAVSGLLLVGFVIAHLLGNLLIYLGPEAINAYAQHLRDLGPLLWVARGALLAAVVMHAATSVHLAVENRRARPQPYQLVRRRETTLAARTMMASGLLLVAYLAYHLLHFTFGATNPTLSRVTDALGRHDVYAMMVLSFQQPAISLAYLLGMTALCLHLGHGIGSVFQTLGLTTERTLPRITRVGRLVALALYLGYISIPCAVLLGIVTMPSRIR